MILFIWFCFCLPSRLFPAPTSYVLEDKDGCLLSASIAADGQWRFPPDENVPAKFAQCITTFEDKRFYYHPGIDPVAFARAAVQNIQTKSVASGGSTLTSNCMSPSEMAHIFWFVLPSTMEFYYKQRHADYKVLTLFMSGFLNEAQSAFEIVYRQEGARIAVPKEITGEKGRTVFTVTARNNQTKLFWNINDVYIGETENFHQIAVNPAPGKHALTDVDENGEPVTRSFEIVEKE
ncbi:transglycosylase domain-containing protein [Parafilimonas sp.]|uniref:transglycosylase domain-containing protein n=1 Tax=Parafilimonas sp. TaxID=1969739 RepID=UPI0039E24845